MNKTDTLNMLIKAAMDTVPATVDGLRESTVIHQIVHTSLNAMEAAGFKVFTGSNGTPFWDYFTMIGSGVKALRNKRKTNIDTAREDAVRGLSKEFFMPGKDHICIVPGVIRQLDQIFTEV